MKAGGRFGYHCLDIGALRHLLFMALRSPDPDQNSLDGLHPNQDGQHTMASINDYLSQAFREGHLQTTHKGKTERVVYAATGHSEKWGGPEEKVRAAFY